MKKQYYSIPFRTDNMYVTKSKRRSESSYCNLYESLHQHIRLLFITAYGELRFDHNYGCELSELDFTNERQSGLYEKKIEDSMYDAIKNYEPRIKNLNLKVTFDRQGQIIKTSNNNVFRIYIVLDIKAQIADTNEPYIDSLKVFFSPLSEN